MSKWGMNTLSLYVQRNEEVISADSRSLISKRYCTVTSAMNREFWNITSDRQNSIYVGSYGRGTAIDTSDIDILMSLPESYYNQFNSVYGNGQSRLLQAVRQAILVRYPRSEVRADGQVVKINFQMECSLKFCRHSKIGMAHTDIQIQIWVGIGVQLIQKQNRMP